VPPILSRRALNRATLARQLLLERSAAGIVEAVERLAGLQAQTPHSWYVGLWSRLAPFDPATAGAGLVERTLVRVVLMRSTIHLVSAADALALRAVMQPMIERRTETTFGRRLAGLDRAALAASARRLLDAQPLTPAELGRGLAASFAGYDAEALSQAVRAWVPLAQVPPRGVWGRSGKPAHAPLDTWVGAPIPPPDPAAAVRRYLAAFGPATVADIRTWSGLAALRDVVDALRADLVVFRDHEGRELFDLEDAPRPDADAPAPPRFLYDYDNLLLSHADRTRVLGDTAYAAFGPEGNRRPSALLVDGFVAATWTTVPGRDAHTLDVHPLRRLTTSEREAVTREGIELLGFLFPGERGDVRITRA
jgi:hypothetical protein